MTLDKLTQEIASSPSAELYYRRGRLLWQMQRHAEAIADYEKSVALGGPDCPAATALEMARRVMNFYHKDRFNP